MTYAQAVQNLLALGRELGAPQQARVQKFGLDNIRVLSRALGNPHLQIPCVHVAGTNGKGSTAAMIESILRAAGFRTGLYTSPHLERINERIRINAEEISDEAFAASWTRVQSTIESLMASGKLTAHPTFFECVTAMAFVAFAHAGGLGLLEREPEPSAGGSQTHSYGPSPGRRDTVGSRSRFKTHPGEGLDFSVYEVGLGGRLDSTNIVEPEVAVITPIDFDHENFLGHSIEGIAAEKAGIIKSGAWVVSAPQRREARAVIARHAQELGARLVDTEAAWRLGAITSHQGFYRAPASADAQGSNPARTVTRDRDGDPPPKNGETASPHADLAEISLSPSLAGKFQIQNALTAATTALLLRERGFEISDEAISAGIASVRWPGRLERLSDRPAVYLDGAHNPAAARELRAFWEENFGDRRTILIYGAMRDKAVDEIAGVLFPRAERVILTQPRQPRAISAAILAEMTAGLARRSTTIADPAEALDQALADAAPEDIIFVTGSLFLVGDLRRHWHARHAVKLSPKQLPA